MKIEVCHWLQENKNFKKVCYRKMNRFIREILKEQKETILWIYQIKTKEILDIIPFNGTNSNNLLSSNLKIYKERSIKMLKK